MSGQERLPRLPINKLENAIEDFLRAAEPLLPPDEFAATKQSAQEFLDNEGPRLHKMLVEYDEDDGRNSYLEVLKGMLVPSCALRLQCSWVARSWADLQSIRVCRISGRTRT